MHFNVNVVITVIVVGVSIFFLYRYLSQSLAKEIAILVLLILKGRKTTGYIISVDEQVHSEGSMVYSAEIEFKTERNESISIRTPFDFMAKPIVGSRIDLIYDPGDPTTGRVYGLGTFLAPVFSFLSIILVIGAIIFAMIKLEILN